MTTYCTSYCNKAHRVEDGKPVRHECHVLPPAAIRLEMDGDVAGAVEAIQRAKPLRTMARGARS